MGFLPENLRGKTIGTWNLRPTIFEDDFARLGCGIAFCDSNSGIDVSADAFVLDCTEWVSKGYVATAKQALGHFEAISKGRSCYGVFPTTVVNYNWDVANHGSPIGFGAFLPGARWIYDHLLGQFAARSVASIVIDGKQCIVSRITPLMQTLFCIMATSGDGKTTLVRQLSNQYNIFHTSSDFLLSTIIGSKIYESSDTPLSRLVAVIESVQRDQIWSVFFRMLDADHSMLSDFLSLAAEHMKLSDQKELISFDIDLRNENSREFAASFFTERGMKVWRCET